MTRIDIYALRDEPNGLSSGFINFDEETDRLVIDFAVRNIYVVPKAIAKKNWQAYINNRYLGILTKFEE